jgi:hypothetical protein
MSVDEESGRNKKARVEATDGSAGKAQKLEPEDAARRAEALGLTPAADLDERQRGIGEKRRHGGPNLDRETEAREEVDEAVPDIEPTEPEEA